MKLCADHARERALERYGVNLTDQDIADLLADVRSGKALTASIGEDGRTCIGRLRGKPVVFVMAADRDFIVTFQPPDYFVKGSKLAHKKRQHQIIKQKPKASKFARNPEYSRALAKRAVRAAARERDT